MVIDFFCIDLRVPFKMNVLRVLTCTLLLLRFSDGKVWDGKVNHIPGLLFSEDLPDAKCKHQFGRFLERVKSIINPLTITVAFDVNSGIFVKSLFSVLGAVQLSLNSSLSSTVTLVFSEADLSIVKSSRNSQFWKPENFYFLFLKNQTLSDLELLSGLWSNFNVYNAFVLKNCGSDHLTGYNPFFDKLEYLPSEEINRKEAFTDRLDDWNGNNFYLIHPGTLQRVNGTLSTGTYDDAIVREVSSSLNAESVLLETDGAEQFGYRADNGSYFGTYRWLMEGRAYMTCGLHFLKWDSIDSEIPFSHHITMEKLCFTVPAVGQVPHFKAILELFNVFAMASILLMYFFAGLVYRLLRCLATRSGLRKKLHTVNITLAIVSLLLGMPLNSKLKAGFERAIIGSLLLINFVITTTFQSTLTTVLSSPVYHKKVENKEELEKSGVEIWSTSKDIMENLQNNGYSRVNFKLKPRNTSSVGFDVGWLGRVNVMLETDYVKYRFFDNYFTKECPTTYSMVYFFNKGLPSKRKVNRIISVLIESGHIVKWVKESYQKNESEMIYRKEKDKESTVNKPLTVTDMKYIFVFLGYSLAFSVIVCMVEIVFDFIWIKKQTKRVTVKKPYQDKFNN